MKYLMVAAVMLCLCSCNSEQKSADRELVWSDEFDYTGLPDTSKWGYDTGGHGWGNNELQYYTQARDTNVQVKDGKLYIKVQKEDYDSAKYTSTRLLTKNKGDWKYGRVEVKAKLPRGRGIWPAIWMLPTYWEYGGWPESGEIDIMEHVGYNPDSVFATVHTKSYNHTIGTHKSAGIVRKDVADVFHVYAMEWKEDKITMFIDDEPFYEFVNEKKTSNEWPFDKKFHLLLNIAVGGGWGGKMGVDDTIFPQQMEVEYVRIYK